ncbi:PPC domain-containing protein [Pyxidicoccus xibeiensis]|uniref:PPC domain-containing protein n=1 Tax=Pyxidicoccus xibeiensis TaxID=2906759 RepID=UPI0020A8293A|nr:PPC domain-containing protein [Pyxidicoccus xibeiensis]MCP3144980.1 PPC domain-containing protein [Pyxidicoccus xibeiensis]
MNCRSLVSLLTGALLLLSACDGEPLDAPSPSPGSQIRALVDGTLVNGQPLTFLAAPTGAQRLYTLDVPANQNAVTFTTTGGPGNADMLVSFGATPTSANALCASAQTGSAETCTVSGRSTAGTWYVLLSATSAFSNVTLTGSYQAGATDSTPTQVLTRGQAVIDLAGAVGSWRTYSLVVPAEQARLDVQVSGGTGDADLYLRQGSAPTLTAYDCRPRTVGNEENCSVNAPQAGTWYILLRGYTVFSGAKLVATTTPVQTPLVNGQPVTALSGASSSLRYFTLDVPAGQSLLKVTLAGGTGDADLYVKQAALPTTSSYDCRSMAGGSTETCSVTSPLAGTWHIMVRGYSAFSGVTLLASTVSDGATGIPLVNGQPVANLASDNGSPSLFRLDVPADVAQVRFEVPSGTTGDYEMYVKRGGEPTTSSYDCKQGSTHGGAASCVFSQPQAGAWYVLLKAAAPENVYRGLSLVGTSSGVVRNRVLTNGQPVTDVSATLNDFLYYTLEVPAGQRRLAVWGDGGTGRGWLHARYGSRPTEATYTCKTLTPNACFIENPQAGTWHFLVRAYEPLSGLTLTAGYSASIPPVTALENGQASAAFSGTPLDVRTFTLQVPPVQGRLTFNLSDAGSGAILYAKHGSEPTRQDYDCAVTCKVDRPTAGTWYVKVFASRPYSGVTLTGGYTAPTPLTNFDSETVVPEDSPSRSVHYYRFEVPPGRTGLSFVASGLVQFDLDLYVKRGALPSRTDHDCASATVNTAYERCDFFDPQEGTWFVRVESTHVYNQPTWHNTVVASHSETGPVSTITDNAPVRVHGDRNSFQTWQLQVPAGQPYLLAEVLDSMKYTWAGGELWLQHEAAPTLFSFKCIARESCLIPEPAAGTWFITLRGAGSFDGALRVTTMSRDRRQLTSGIWENPLNGEPDSMTLYTLEVPAGASDLSFRLMAQATNGRFASLFVRQGTPPNEYQYDCKVLNGVGKEGNCDFVQPRAGTWYVGVRDAQGGSLARVRGTYAMTPGEGIPELTPFVARSGLSGAEGSVQHWKMEVPAGQRMLWFATRAGLGDATLRVKVDGRPVAGASLDCVTQSTDEGRLCFIPNPRAGTWFVSLVGGADYKYRSLTGAYVNANTVASLTNGVPIPSLWVGNELPQYFKLEVPPGEALLTFDVDFLAQEKGALQVHISRDALPTTAGTPCAEPSAGVVRCRVLSPEAGTWYARVMSTRSGTNGWVGGVRLVGFHAPQVDDVPLLLNGSPTRGLSGSATQTRVFKLMAPEGARELVVMLGSEVSPARGVVSVAFRKGSPPTATEWDCASAPGNGAYCQRDTPAAGLWYVSVTPSSYYSDIYLVALAR